MEFSLKEKLEHRRNMKKRVLERFYLDKGLDPCLRPWYALTIRSDGNIPIYCVRQHILMGSIYKIYIKDIWHSDNFLNYRNQMRKLILLGKDFKNNFKDDTLSKGCLLTNKGFNSCPFRSFYYRKDFGFMKKLESIIGKDSSKEN